MCRVFDILSNQKPIVKLYQQTSGLYWKIIIRIMIKEITKNKNL